MKNKHQHNEDGTTFVFIESKSKHFPGKHAIIIDTEDWDKVKEHKWRVHPTGSRYPYAATNIPHPDGGWYYYTGRNGKSSKTRRRTIRQLHQLVMGKPQGGMVVDHINHNGLDNRKENLRFVTLAQNQQNRRSGRNSSSQYKGVSRRKADNKWQARIDHEGKQTHLGRYDCEHQAALAYNKKALELWGEYAHLNEVEIQ